MDLYRGKSKSTGEWIIGAVICLDEKAYILGSENLIPERPAYHSMAIGAGLEDQDITDRYEAAAYGWTEALNRYEESFPEWVEVEPDTVTRCCEKRDRMGNVLFEGDVYRDRNFRKYEICYGKYQAYCPASKIYEDNVGFFAISDDLAAVCGVEAPMPLGDTENEGLLVGDIFSHPMLRQKERDPEQDTNQGGLMPAT